MRVSKSGIIKKKKCVKKYFKNYKENKQPLVIKNLTTLSGLIICQFYKIYLNYKFYFKILFDTKSNLKIY